MESPTPSTSGVKRLLLLHGAGLGGWIWDRVLPELAAPAEAIDLPGRSGKGHPRDVTLQQCIDHVASRARGYRSIIVGHSFSAQIALGVASAYPQHVAAIVLVGGITAKSGENFLSVFPAPQRWFLRFAVKRARDGVRLPPKAVKREYCNDLGDATDVVLAKLTPEAPALYLDRVTWAAMPADLPRLYVKLLKDKAVPPRQQDEMMWRVGPIMLETLNAGHLPMLGHPRELAAILNRFVFSV